VDFPAIVDNQEVYLCWKLGEIASASYHRQDEGSPAASPWTPRDLGPGRTLQ